MKLDSYSLRHGGASADRLDNRRSIAAVKRRGRWRADASLRRYEKSTVALREAGRMGASAVAYGHMIDNNLQAMLMGEMRAPAPPGFTPLPHLSQPKPKRRRVTKV
jgi:hypothetical protein